MSSNPESSPAFSTGRYAMRCTPPHAPWRGALRDDPKETTKRTRHID